MWLLREGVQVSFESSVTRVGNAQTRLVTMLALTAHSSDRLKIVIRQFRHVLSPDLLETSILQYMEKLPTEDGRTLWQCTLCGKVHHLKHVISDHVEALHLSDIEFECPYCQKKKKSRSNLRAHISTYHREEHQMSKHSDFLWSIEQTLHKKHFLFWVWNISYKCRKNTFLEMLDSP